MIVAICEDQPIYVSALENAINSWIEQHNFSDVSIVTYISAEDLLDDWESGKLYDILFLDILFDYMTGYTLAQKIREKDPSVPIVFVTNSDNFILQGYKVDAHRYLKKPVNQRDINDCLDYSRKQLQLIQDEGFLIVKKGVSVRLPYRSIIYISYNDHSITINTTEGLQHTVSLKGSFETYCSELPGDRFLRCHQGYIINLQYVHKYTRNQIILATQALIPIGRRYTKPVIEHLNKQFYRGF